MRVISRPAGSASLDAAPRPQARNCGCVAEVPVDPGLRQAVHEFIDRESRMLPEALIAETAIEAYLDKALARGECLLHLHNGMIVGLLLGYCNAPDRSLAYVSLLLVSGETRGQGLGRILMRNFAELAQRRGFGCIQLEVSQNNPEAGGFYRQLGFHPLAQRGRMTLMQLDLPGATEGNREPSSLEEPNRG